MNEHVIAYLLTRYRLTVSKHFKPIDKAIDREVASGLYEAHQQERLLFLAIMAEMRQELEENEQALWQQVQHFQAALV